MHVMQYRPNRIGVRVCQGLESEVLIAPPRFDLKIGALIQCSAQPSSGPVPTASQLRSFLLPPVSQQLCLNVMFKSETVLHCGNHAAGLPSGPRIFCPSHGCSESLSSFAFYRYSLDRTNRAMRSPAGRWNGCYA
jgi:hypothetical protein